MQDSNKPAEGFQFQQAKNKVYLEMITMAVHECSDNRQGLLRKRIWQYLMDEFPTSVDYRDFLIAIAALEKSGKLINKNGYFFVDPYVYHEVCTRTRDPQAYQTPSSQRYGQPSQKNFAQSNCPSGRSSVRREGFKQKIAQHKPNVPARSVSVLYKNAARGTDKKSTAAQVKLDQYFATHSAKRQSHVGPSPLPVMRNDFDMPNPLADIKKALNIRDKEEAVHPEVKQEDDKEKRTLGFSSFGFVQNMKNVSQTPLHKPNVGVVTRQSLLRFDEKDTCDDKAVDAIKDPATSIKTPSPISAKQSPTKSRHSKMIKKDTQKQKPQPKQAQKKTPSLTMELRKSPRRVPSNPLTPKRTVQSPRKKVQIQSPKKVTPKKVVTPKKTPTQLAQFTMTLRSSGNKSAALPRLARSKAIKKGRSAARTTSMGLMRETFADKNFKSPHKTRQTKLDITKSKLKFADKVDEITTQSQTNQRKTRRSGSGYSKVSQFDAQSTVSKRSTRKTYA